MPVLATTAYSTAGQITLLVRSLLNDAPGSVYTDTLLFPYVNAAYRKVQSAIANIMGPTFINDDVLLVLPAVAAQDASLQCVLSDAGYNNGTLNYTSYDGDVLQLPTDLLVPLKVWERQSGTSDDFDEMEDVTNNGGLPSEEQDAFLNYFEWRGDGLWFLGAIQDQQIRLRYKKALPDLVNAASVILIRQTGVVNAIAFLTASDVGNARGVAGADKYEQKGIDSLEDLLAAATLQLQRAGGRRRRPFGRRRGTGPGV